MPSVAASSSGRAPRRAVRATHIRRYARPVKTTVDLPDAVLDAARERARRDGTSLRALLIDGLRKVLEEDDTDQIRYRYKPVLSDGSGEVQPGVDLSDWATVRRLI